MNQLPHIDELLRFKVNASIADSFKSFVVAGALSTRMAAAIDSSWLLEESRVRIHTDNSLPRWRACRSVIVDQLCSLGRALIAQGSKPTGSQCCVIEVQVELGLSRLKLVTIRHRRHLSTELPNMHRWG